MGLSREEAVRTLDEGHRIISELAGRLPDEVFGKGSTIGGGDWSAQDLVAHLTTWEETALEALEQWRQGATPTVETEIFRAGAGVDDFNAKTVEAKRRKSPEEVRESGEGVHAALVREIEGMSDEEWGALAPYPTERRRHLFELLGSILGAPKRPFGHALAHVADLQAYVESLA